MEQEIDYPNRFTIALIKEIVTLHHFHMERVLLQFVIFMGQSFFVWELIQPVYIISNLPQSLTSQKINAVG